MKLNRTIIFLTAATLLALTAPFMKAQTGDTAYGANALLSLTTGNNNSAFGDSALYSTTSGEANTALGFQSLYYNTTGQGNTAVGLRALWYGGSSGNTAVGWYALWYNYAGSGNVAVGGMTLISNSEGTSNVAVGYNALPSNTTGNTNIAVGYQAAYGNTTGTDNVASGNQALYYNSTGNYNIAIGAHAGAYLTTGDNNIDIGNTGVADEGGTIRIGDQNTHTAAYVAGIYGATATDGVAVYIDADGHLGTATSSRRFKRDITDMDASSEAILSLRPVSFRYKPEIDARGIPHYGLIAEEVAEISPDLVQRDSKGEIYTVRYEAVNAMLLNEFQKEHKRVQAQDKTIAQQQEQIRMLSDAMAELRQTVEGHGGEN
jgi:hypothetical protein